MIGPLPMRSAPVTDDGSALPVARLAASLSRRARSAASRLAARLRASTATEDDGAVADAEVEAGAEAGGGGGGMYEEGRSWAAPRPELERLRPPVELIARVSERGMSANRRAM